MILKNTNDIVIKIKGLTQSDVVRSRNKFGDNQLVAKGKQSILSEFLGNFGDPIIKILLIALTINIVFMMRNFSWYESAGIAAAILLSTLVSTISEHGSESAFDKLQQEALKTKCRVKRSEGLLEVPVSEVVVGDYVLLQSGDRVAADGIMISGELYVDQSPLNGESKEAYKEPGENISKTGDLSDKNWLFRGCVVCSGEGIMLVRDVGGNTFYGKLAQDVQEQTRESPLKHRLGKLAEGISRLGYMGAGLVAFADLFNSILITNGFDINRIALSLNSVKSVFEYLIHAATLAITVIVVAVPEGLPLMITVVLSSNMKRMLKDNVLVRKLVGIETSGSLNILFADKTGTITKGKLKVNSFTLGNGNTYDSFMKLKKTNLSKIVELTALYNTGSSLETAGKKKKAVGGNATERALMEYVYDDISTDLNIKVDALIPFNSMNKYSAAQVLDLTLVKGAPEKILPCCQYYLDENGEKRNIAYISSLRSKMNEMSGKAVRLLAIAVGSGPINRDGVLRNLTLVGIVGIRDEIRREAAKAINQVVGAGIQVVMITGDNKETASAIAREVGLIKEWQSDAVITSDELKRMSDSELKSRLPSVHVIARALPSDKSRLIKISQELGLVAGMTGDGINDAPALKKADVGFAMGSGTEVAKEASDIIILDDNFLSISKAILYGRTIFKSIRKFIIFQLTLNLCAVGISIIGPFIGINSPITVLQMLWVNMVMDTLAGLAFAGEAPLNEYMKERPKKRDEPIINSYMLNQILVTGTYISILCILFLKLPMIHEMFDHGNGNGYFMTAFFALFIFAGVFNGFNTRTTRLMLLSHVWQNKGFLTVMLFVSIVQLVIIYYGGAIFRTTGLSFTELETVLFISFSVIPFDFMRKIFLGTVRRGSAI